MKTRPIPTPPNWKNLEPHPLATLTEFGAGIDIDGLADHMRLHGYDPDESIIMHDGMILDGRHKHAAAIKAGVTPTFREFIGVNAAAYVCKKAFRQHLDTSQRAMIAATLTKINTTKKLLLEEESVGNPTGEMSQGQAAKSLNVSRESVNNAVTVQERGTEKLQEAVREGTVTVSDAAKVASQPAKVQNAAVKDVKTGKAGTVSEAVALFCQRCAKWGPARDCPECAKLRPKKGGKGGPKQGAEAFSLRTLNALLGRVEAELDKLAHQYGKVEERRGNRFEPGVKCFEHTGLLRQITAVRDAAEKWYKQLQKESKSGF